MATENKYEVVCYEIKYVTTIDVPALRKQIDKFSQQLRMLDIEIQALNFITEME